MANQVLKLSPNWLEVTIPHHQLLARPDDGGQIGQLYRAQRRHADPKADQAVGGVAIGWVERGQ